MRDYGIVSPKFWIGGTGKALRGRLDLQVEALYLMTSPHANMIGVFYCPLDSIAKETGLPLEGATKALASLIEAQFCQFDEDTEEVFVRRMAAFQIGEQLKPDDNRCKGIARELEKVSSDKLRRDFHAIYSGAFHLPDLPGQKPKKTSPSKGPKKPLRSQKQDQDQDQDQKDSAEPQGSAQASGFAIPLNDGSEWEVPAGDMAEWIKAFPAADVEQELRAMRAWALANPAKRKTSRGVAAFAVRWLGKAQDTPGRSRGNSGAADWTGSAT
jgi:hypothetical protein